MTLTAEGIYVVVPNPGNGGPNPGGIIGGGGFL